VDTMALGKGTMRSTMAMVMMSSKLFKKKYQKNILQLALVT
jgi:hypothetical protein